MLVVVSGAAGAWSPPRWVSAEGWSATDSPTVAVDRQGDALLVWEACDLRTAGCYHQIQARTRSRSGALGPIVNVSELGPAPAWPQVGSDDDGDSLVVWQQHDTHTNWRIAARRLGRGGAVGPVLMLTPDRPIGNNPQVAVAPGGRALVVWTEYHATASAGAWSTVARQVSREGAVGPRLELGGGSAEAPAVAMDRRGTAVVAWTDYGRVYARRIRPNGVSPARVVAAGGTPGHGFALVHASSARRGEFVISFRSGVGPRPRVRLRRWTSDGSLGRSLAISPRPQSAGFHHALAADLEGGAVVLWTRELAANRLVVYGRKISRTGTAGRVVRLGAGDHPDVAVDDDGDGIAVWQPPDDEARPVRRSTITRRGGFGPVRTIGRDGRVPRVAATPTGRTVAVWQQHAHPYRIQTASGP